MSTPSRPDKLSDTVIDDELPEIEYWLLDPVKTAVSVPPPPSRVSLPPYPTSTSLYGLPLTISTPESSCCIIRKSSVVEGVVNALKRVAAGTLIPSMRRLGV